MKKTLRNFRNSSRPAGTFRLLSAVCAVCLLLSFTACSGGKSSANPFTGKTGGAHTGDVAVRLAAVNPAAYTDIDGLNLDAGITICLIARGADGSYWKQLEAGAKQAVSDINKMLGYTGDKKIKLSYSAPDENDDIDEQINILDEELNRNPAAIAIAAIDMSAFHSQFSLAADSDIPIITFDSATDYANVGAHIATDDTAASKTAADRMADLTGGGEIAVFTQDSLSSVAKDREKGFADAIAAEHPDMRVVEVCHLDSLDDFSERIAAKKNQTASGETSDADGPGVSGHEDTSEVPSGQTAGATWNPSETLSAGTTQTSSETSSSGTGEEPQAAPTAKEVTKFILEEHPNLKGIYAASEEVTGILADVLSEMKRTDITLIGYGGGKSEDKLINKGVLDGMILRNPYGTGYATVVAAARSILGLYHEAFVDSGYIWVTKKNLKDENVKSMMY